MPASHREQLIEGAIRCLQTKGFARTTARDIAAASGANLASIGYHFGSKEALLTEALIRVFEQRNRRVGQVTFEADAASPRERLTASFAAVRAMFEEHRPLLVAFVEAMAECQHSDELRRALAAHYQEGRRAIAAWIRSGLDRPDEHFETDGEVMASFLMATLDGLVLQFLLEPADTPSGEDLVSALAETMAVVLEQKT